MAPFNWFRRQFDEDENKKAESAETVAESSADSDESVDSNAPDAQQSPEAYLQWAKAAYQNIQKRQQEVSPAPETAPETATSESQDAVVGSAATPTTVSPEPSTAKPEVAPVSEAAEQIATVATAAPSPETVEAEAQPASEATEEAAGEPEAIPADSAIEPDPTPVQTAEPATEDQIAVENAPAASEPTPVASEAAIAPEPTPEPTTAAPFWARAEAERQERLERIKASAIEVEPEPEPQSVAASSATPAPTTGPATEPAFDLDEGFLWSAEVLAAQGRRPEEVSIEEITWLKRLRQGLDKTRRGLVNQLKSIVGQGPLNQAAVMEIEALLLQADVGIEATDHVIEALQKRLRQEALPPEAAIAYLKKILRDMLDRPLGGTYNPTFAPEKDTFNIWLITGVNGAGKTTTIGKIAHLAQKSEYRCLIAAADTFRAAAVEQVKVWGERSGVDVIANPGKNTDPAAVVFDAISAARSRQTELLLVDTAGRLQNKKNLMEELSKVRRVIDRKAEDAKVESLLVLDATLGQNGLRQAEVFSEAAQLSGVVLTKLDGTAKGGIALAIVQQLGLPIRFIGAGEGIEDLRPFSSYEFVEALLSG